MDVATYVSEVVSYDDRQFVPGLRSYRSRRVSLVDRAGRFPPGCLPFLKRLAADEGHQVTVTDCRTAPKAKLDASVWDEFPDDLPPMDFQRTGVMTLFEKTIGIVKADVGAGKSLCIAMAVAAMPIKWLILVHRDNLVGDLSALFTKIGIEHTTHTSKRRKISQVTIATFSSASKPEQLRALTAGVQGVIVDEAHTAAADSRADVLASLTSAYYRFGLSGTPFDRSDSKSIVVVGHLGSIVYKIDTQELEGLGRIVPANVRMVDYAHQQPTKKEYSAIYREVIVTNPGRNALVVEMVRRAAKPCMVFIQHKEHLKLLVAALNKAFADSKERIVFAWGDTPDEVRKELVGGVRDGEYDILVASVVFQEGVNIPDLRSVVLASAGKATIATVQRLGRGTRSSAGKTEFELWDIQDREIEMFYRQAQVRIRTYRKRGYEPRFLTQEDLQG